MNALFSDFSDSTLHQFLPDSFEGALFASMHSSAMCGLDTKVNKASKAPTLWSSLQSYQFSTVFNQLLSMWICLLLTTHDNTTTVSTTINKTRQCSFYPQSRPIITDYKQTQESRLYLVTCVCTSVYLCVYVLCSCSCILDDSVRLFIPLRHSSLLAWSVAVKDKLSLVKVRTSSQNQRCMVHVSTHYGKGTKSSWLYHIQISTNLLE